MAWLVRLVAALVGVSALVEPACHREDAKMNRGQAASSPQRSVETLGKMVTLPIAPAEVWFEDVPEGIPGGLGPTDYLLVAVLRFDRDLLAGFAKTAPGRRNVEPYIASLANRPWFPPPVRAAIHPRNSDSVAVRGTMFDGAPFAKGAFSEGAFVVVEGGEYVVLVLGTS